MKHVLATRALLLFASLNASSATIVYSYNDNQQATSVLGLAGISEESSLRCRNDACAQQPSQPVMAPNVRADESASAIPETFTVLGRPLRVAPPTGYCPPKHLSREQLEQQARLMEFSGLLLQLAVPCAELPRVVEGKAKDFTHWAIISVVKKRGHLIADPRSRSVFLKDMGSATKFDLAAANRNVRTALAGTGRTANLNSVELLGTTDDAVYWSFRGARNLGQGVEGVYGVTAVTLVKGLALSIQVRGSTHAVDVEFGTVAQSFVRTILAAN